MNPTGTVALASGTTSFRQRIRAHISIARPDHIVKNVFAIPAF